MHRGEIRNANLKQRFDARSRHNAMVQPHQFVPYRPWWELRQIRLEQEQAQARAARPVLTPIQKPSPLKRAINTLRQLASWGTVKPVYGAAHA